MLVDIDVVLVLDMCKTQKLSRFVLAINWEASVAAQWMPHLIPCTASLVTVNLLVFCMIPTKVATSSRVSNGFDHLSLVCRT